MRVRYVAIRSDAQYSRSTVLRGSTIRLRSCALPSTVARVLRPYKPSVVLVPSRGCTTAWMSKLLVPRLAATTSDYQRLAHCCANSHKKFQKFPLPSVPTPAVLSPTTPTTPTTLPPLPPPTTPESTPHTVHTVHTSTHYQYFPHPTIPLPTSHLKMIHSLKSTLSTPTVTNPITTKSPLSLLYLFLSLITTTILLIH